MKPVRWFAVCVSMLLCAGTQSRAQTASVAPVDASLTPAPATAVAAGTAPLLDRIAAAKSVKVLSSVLGVTLGSELDEAHRKLDRLSAVGKPPKEEGGDREEKNRDKIEGKNGKGEHDVVAKGDCEMGKPKVDADADEGHKVLWQLAGTDYSAVYITADDDEKIISMTGILRPGKEMPFDKVGETAKAPFKNSDSAVWDVLRPGRPLYRVLARGTNGKAATITLFVVRQKPAVMVRHIDKAGSDFR